VLKAKVEKTWLLCYGKTTLPYSKFIAKEFALGIVVEKLGQHFCSNGTHSKHERERGFVLEFTTIFIRNLLLTAYFQILVDEDQITSCK
jgi:hypothetical protein